MRAAAVGKAATPGKGLLVAITWEQVIRFLFAQLFKPDIMVLALLFVYPDYSVADVDGDLCRGELKFVDLDFKGLGGCEPGTKDKGNCS